MVIVVLCGLFSVVIGSPALLGVWVSRLWYRKLPKDAEIQNASGIAVGIAVVSAFCAVAPLSPDFQKFFGPWISFAGIYALAMLIVGLFIGWVECRDVTGTKT